MTAGTASPAPRVVFLVGESAPSYQTVRAALAAVGVEVVRVGDVFLAMGEIVRSRTDKPLAVLVDPDAVDPSETSFFRLAARMLAPTALCVLPGSPSRRLVRREAEASGAIGVDPAAAGVWAAGLVEACVARPERPEPLERPSTRRPVGAAGLVRPSTTEPSASTPRERGDVPDLTAARIAAPSPPERPRLRLAHAEPAPAPRPLSQPDDVVVASGGEAAADSPAETDAPAAPVPWKPAANRPIRTRPGAAAVPPPADSSHRPTDADVELTSEELDALLDRGDAARARKQAP